MTKSAKERTAAEARNVSISPLPGEAASRRLMLLRMAFGSLPAALSAASDVPGTTDEEAIGAARTAAIALVEAAVGSS